MKKKKKIIPIVATSILLLSNTSQSLAFYSPKLISDYEKINQKNKEAYKSTVSIVGIDIDTNKRVANANISILKNGKKVKFDKNNQGYQFNENGRYDSISLNYVGEIEVFDLPDGEYEIQYMKNLQGYELVGTKVFNVSSNKITNLNLSFDLLEGKSVISLTSEDKTAISGSEFIIKNQNGNKMTFDIVNGTYVYSEQSNHEILKTNTGGKIFIDKLPVGNYVIEQISSPKLYNGAYIKSNFVVYKNDITYISLESKKEYGNLNITYSDEKGVLLSGGKIQIKNQNGEYLKFIPTNNGYKFDYNGSETTLLIKDKNGLFLEGLPKGEYIVEAISNPNTNYNLKEKQKNVSIINKGNSKLDFSNKRAVGDLTINIVSMDDSKELIDGATFRLKQSNSSEFMRFSLRNGIYTYNENGEIIDISSINGKVNVVGIPTNNIEVIPTENEKLISSSLNFSKAIMYTQIKNEQRSELSFSVSKSQALLRIIDEKNIGVSGVEINVKSKNNSFDKTFKTNESGCIDLSLLKKGKYTYEVKSVPEGYSRNVEKYDFELLEDGKFAFDDLKLDNSKIKVSIEKIDGFSPKGIKVELKSLIGEKNIVGEIDEYGIFEFEKIPFGEYQLSVLESVDGYEWLNDSIKITIDDKYTNIEEIKFTKNGIDTIGMDDGKLNKNISSSLFFVASFILIMFVCGLLYFVFYCKGDIKNKLKGFLNNKIKRQKKENK